MNTEPDEYAGPPIPNETPAKSGPVEKPREKDA
jgi:hypothetical protein